jgi:hypothetical protein
MSYSIISNFGSSNKAGGNPLGLCTTSTLDSAFNGTLGGNNMCGPNSQQCQLFMGSYCGQNWDNVCEYASKDTSQFLPNSMGVPDSKTWKIQGSGLGNAMTKGQMLIRNSASEKFLIAMSDNCSRDYEPFDPTVANSPMIGRWKSNMDNGSCVPIYGVNPDTIDSDPVMNKILDQPWIAIDILVNIYQNALNSGDIQRLQGTRLGKFFISQNFQDALRSGNL